MRKLFIFFFIVAFSITAFPYGGVYIDDGGNEWLVNNLPDVPFGYGSWSLGNTATLVKYSGENSLITTPKLITGYDSYGHQIDILPCRIEENCFADLASLETIVFSRVVPLKSRVGNNYSIQEAKFIICKNAIINCPNLKRIVFMNKGSDYEIEDDFVNNCPNLQEIIFADGAYERNEITNDWPALAKGELTFGGANPTIYISNNYVPELWSGYPTVDTYRQEILDQCLLKPQEAGQPGQVLTKTENGHAWMNIPVDDELDETSENALQNKVITQELQSLLAADSNVAETLATMQETDETLTSGIASNLSAIEALQKTTGEQKTAIESNGAAITANGEAIATNLQSIESIQAENVERDSAISALQADNAELKRQLSALLQFLNGGSPGQVLAKAEDGSYAWMAPQALGYEIHTLQLVKGWNLVAMPGRIVLKESDEALLAQVQVFSYDKTQQCYLKPDELLPLASYWFYVKEDCSLHFAIAAEETPSPEVQ